MPFKVFKSDQALQAFSVMTTINRQSTKKSTNKIKVIGCQEILIFKKKVMQKI